MQSEKATSQLTAFTCLATLGRRLSVQVEPETEQASAVFRAAVLLDRLMHHARSKPEPPNILRNGPTPGMFGWAPAPVAGALCCVPPPAATKARKRPTVTSKR